MMSMIRFGWQVSAMCILIGAASCSSPRPSGGQQGYTTAQSFPPSLTQDTPHISGDQEKSNVPSAPLTTPLCGTALHEQAQTGAGIYSRGLTSGNPCTQNACFQPLTGTFIAQNGTNSVCR